MSDDVPDPVHREEEREAAEAEQAELRERIGGPSISTIQPSASAGCMEKPVMGLETSDS